MYASDGVNLGLLWSIYIDGRNFVVVVGSLVRLDSHGRGQNSDRSVVAYLEWY